MLCVINWKKINSNKFTGNQQCNSHLHFPGQHNSFQIFTDFSIPIIIFKGFQGLENPYIKLKDFPYFSRICTNPENSRIV